MALFYAYSFTDVLAGIAGPGGAFPLAGTENGTADEGITITYADDKGALQMGADGSWMHTLNASNSGSASVTLLKNSPINQLLQIMYDLQRSSSTNWGQNTISLTQIVSGDLYLLEGVAFKKFPDVTWGKAGPTLKWDFNVGRIDPSLGSGV